MDENCGRGAGAYRGGGEPRSPRPAGGAFAVGPGGFALVRLDVRDPVVATAAEPAIFSTLFAGCPRTAFG